MHKISKNRGLMRVFSLLVISAICIGSQMYFWDLKSDDAFIYFRYVERFCNGLGLTFSDVSVEGYSHRFGCSCLVRFFQ